MRHEFLPAIGPYITDKGPWRHPIHWLDRETAVFYPYFLGSYALWRDTSFPVHRNGITIFGDSGGYTLVTQADTSIDPTDVIRWQVERCTRGVILDVPPYRPNSAIQFRGVAGQWWEESIERTVKNVRRALPYYLNAHPDLTEAGVQQTLVGSKFMSPFRWWGVVQGETREQMEEWHGKVSEVYPFTETGEGWALAPKPSTDLLSCARYMRFAHDKGLKNVHLLQVTAEKTVGVVLALGVLGGNFELVTYDSASALRCAINRSGIIHDGLGMSYIKEARKTDLEVECTDCHKVGWDCLCRNNERTVELFMKECPCQACQWFREDFPLTNREYPHSILLHNHLVMVEACERIYQAALKDPDQVLRWAAGPLYGDVLREWEKASAARPKSQTRVVPLTERIR